MVDQVVPPKRSYGRISVLLALGTFTLAMTATMVTVQMSRTPGLIYDVAFPIFAVLVGVAAPAAHAVGVALGIAAITRKGDRRGLGILGTCLNAVAIFIVVSLIYIALQGLAAFR
jgi:hypothetical protein